MKYIPYSLLLAFGIKGLVYGLSWELVASILCLGVISYLLEKRNESDQLTQLRSEAKEHAIVIEELRNDMQETKSFVTSVKLNGMRNGYRSSQQ